MKEMNEKMGTHKFRLSDIMPHSWLYNKLKGISSRSSRKILLSSPKHLSSDASSSRKLRDPHPHPHPHLSSPPKSSFKRRIKRKTVYKPSSRLKPSSLKSHVSRNHCSNSINLDPSVSVFSHCASSPSHQGYEFSCHPQSPSKDTVIDIKDDYFLRTLDDVPEVTIVSDARDPPIPVNSCLVRVENVKELPFEKLSPVARKSKANNFAGIRLRVNSAKIARKKTKERASPVSKKIETAESFAIVLSSADPEKDFRESMVEMIMENNIRGQSDLEDLLACYLSLNSSEYHDVIIKAFQKTWFHLTHLRL